MSDKKAGHTSLRVSEKHLKLLDDTWKSSIGPYRITKTSIIERGIELAAKELQLIRDCQVRSDE